MAKNRPSVSSQAHSMRGPGSKPSLLFQLLIPSTAIFIITILSLIAVLFSDQRAPVAIFLNKHGNSLLAAEFVAVMLLSFLAMTVDRIQTLRDMKKLQEQDSKSAEVVMKNDAPSHSTNATN